MIDRAYLNFKNNMDKMLPPDCKMIIAGFSGGADSLCMVLLTEKYIREYRPDVRLVCAHLDHMIRGKDAEDDMAFAAEVCKELNIELRTRKEDIVSISKSLGRSEEMTGRERRYAFFNEIAGEFAGYAPKIAVAHTANDKAETVFLNMARGTGISGLTGIKSVNGNIIRPLINFTRQETEEVCRYFGYEFRTDKTNLDNRYKRNAVRNIIFPEINKYFDGFPERLISLSEISEEEDSYLEMQAAEAKIKCIISSEEEFALIDRKVFSTLHDVIKKRTLRLIISEIHRGDYYPAPSCVGIDRDNTERLCDFIISGATGKTFKLPKGIRAVSYSDSVRIYLKDETKISVEKGELTLPVPSKNETLYTEYDGTKYYIKFADRPDDRDTVFKDNEKEAFDADKFLSLYKEGRAPVFRKMLPEDRIRPYKGSGGKPLRRFFTDIKIPADKRSTKTLLASGKDILWIPEIRRSDFAPVEKDTKSVIIIGLC